MIPARSVYSDLKNRLAERGFTAASEANVLFERAVGNPYREVSGTDISEDRAKQVLALLKRRLAGEPLQYIAGSWPFLDFELAVGAGVLIPRPETERVAQKAIKLLNGNPGAKVLDLCSGSGCIAIAIRRACPGAEVVAVELEDGAYNYLTKNIAALAPDIKPVRTDAKDFSGSCARESVDLIVANPPYVTPEEYRENLAELEYEPPEAFLGGADGLDFYRWIIRNYRESLKENAWMLLETGFNQTETVARIFAKCQYQNIETVTDDFGMPRMVLAQK